MVDGGMPMMAAARAMESAMIGFFFDGAGFGDFLVFMVFGGENFGGKSDFGGVSRKNCKQRNQTYLTFWRKIDSFGPGGGGGGVGEGAWWPCAARGGVAGGGLAVDAVSGLRRAGGA